MATAATSDKDRPVARCFTITSAERCHALAIVPGESVLKVDCGSGVIMRTAGANCLIGRDMST